MLKVRIMFIFEPATIFLDPRQLDTLPREIQESLYMAEYQLIRHIPLFKQTLVRQARNWIN